jgi:hypothetical protein
MDDLPEDLAKPRRKALDGDIMGIIVGATLIVVLIAMLIYVAVS